MPFIRATRSTARTPVRDRSANDDDARRRGIVVADGHETSGSAARIEASFAASFARTTSSGEAHGIGRGVPFGDFRFSPSPLHGEHAARRGRSRLPRSRSRRARWRPQRRIAAPCSGRRSGEALRFRMVRRVRRAAVVRRAAPSRARRVRFSSGRSASRCAVHDHASDPAGVEHGFHLRGSLARARRAAETAPPTVDSSNGGFRRRSRSAMRLRSSVLDTDPAVDAHLAPARSRRTRDANATISEHAVVRPELRQWTRRPPGRGPARRVAFRRHPEIRPASSGPREARHQLDERREPAHDDARSAEERIAQRKRSEHHDGKHRSSVARRDSRRQAREAAQNRPNARLYAATPATSGTTRVGTGARTSARTASKASGHAIVDVTTRKVAMTRASLRSLAAAPRDVASAKRPSSLFRGVEESRAAAQATTPADQDSGVSAPITSSPRRSGASRDTKQSIAALPNAIAQA